MRRIVPSVPFLLQAALGQTPARLTVATDDPVLAELFAELTVAAVAPPPRDVADAPGGGSALAQHVLGCLRAGDLAAAQRALAAAHARARADDAAPTDRWWFLLALGWFVDASEDPAAADACWPLAQRLARPLAAAPTALHYADECLVIQALFASAALRLRRGRSGVHCADLALARLEQLETVWAQRMRGRFASQRREGLTARRAHPPADVRDLDPAWFGLPAVLPMRQRHDDTALTDLTEQAVANPAADTLAAAASRLAAAAMLRDAPARLAAYRAVRRLAAKPASPGDAARALDALLLALTGIRHATDFTLEDGFVLLSPWLPPDLGVLAVRGIAARGAVLDLAIERRDGPPRADEVDVTACVGGDRPRLASTVALRGSVSGVQRLVVVLGDWQTLGHELAVGDRWLTSLPTLQLETQDQPR